MLIHDAVQTQQDIKEAPFNFSVMAQRPSLRKDFADADRTEALLYLGMAYINDCTQSLWQTRPTHRRPYKSLGSAHAQTQLPCGILSCPTHATLMFSIFFNLHV